LDTDELIQRAERELAEGNRSARKTLDRVRAHFVEQRDAEGLEGLLVLADRLDDGGDLAYTIRQNLKGLSRQPEGQRSPTDTPSSLEQTAGITLFLVVTGCWLLGVVSAELDWIAYSDVFVLAATVLSIASVVLTGYLGRIQHALWVGWIPGAAMMAIGFAMSPDPGGDETGGALIFIGGLVLFGWAVFFFPLIALGVYLRRRRDRRPTAASPYRALDGL